MESYKQILFFLASIVWILICVNGSIIRQKRDGPGAIASFFIDKASEGMAIIEHGAGYKGQQNHQFDFFGAKAGVDAKPNIGFGDTARTDSDESERRKRQAENQGNSQQDESNGEIQDIFKQMWGAVVDGGKQIFHKLGEMIDPEGAERQKQQQQPQQQQQTY